MKALLGARHAEDLPSKEVLDKHPGADEALRELAGSADQVVTRVRAHYGAQGPPTDGPDDHRWIVTIEPDRVNVTGGR